jgi:hypothetical protein
MVDYFLWRPYNLAVPFADLCEGQPPVANVIHGADSLATSSMDMDGEGCPDDPHWEMRSRTDLSDSFALAAGSQAIAFCAANIHSLEQMRFEEDSPGYLFTQNITYAHLYLLSLPFRVSSEGKLRVWPRRIVVTCTHLEYEQSGEGWARLMDAPWVEMQLRIKPPFADAWVDQFQVPCNDDDRHAEALLDVSTEHLGADWLLSLQYSSSCMLSHEC